MGMEEKYKSNAPGKEYGSREGNENGLGMHLWISWKLGNGIGIDGKLDREYIRECHYNEQCIKYQVYINTEST